MQKFDTLIPLAEREIARLLARQPARDGGKTNGNPPKPPAYVQVKRAQSKRRPKQLRLAIERWNIERQRA